MFRILESPIKSTKSLHKRLLGGASQEDTRPSVAKNTVDRLLLHKVIPIPAIDGIATEVQDLWKKDSIKDEALYRPLRAMQELLFAGIGSQKSKIGHLIKMYTRGKAIIFRQ